MNRPSLKIARTVLAAACLLALAPAAHAQAASRASVESAAADAALVNLTLTGRNFLRLRSPAVFLSGHASALPVVSVSDGSLTALLPPGIAAGSYYVTLRDAGNNGIGTEDEFAFTLGAQGVAGVQGPQGPQGIAGATGPRGEPGAAGAAGAQGAQGDAGPAGAPGPQGPQGSTGPAGPQGPTGVKGDPGQQGPMGFPGPPGPVAHIQGPQGPTGPTGPLGTTGQLVVGGTDTSTANVPSSGTHTIASTTLFLPPSGATVDAWITFSVTGVNDQDSDTFCTITYIPVVNGTNRA